MNVGEDIPPHVRFDEGAQPVAPVADDVLKRGSDEVRTDEATDEQHKEPHQSAVVGHGGQKRTQQILGHQGEGHINGGDHQGAGQIKDEKTQMGPVIGKKTT